MLEFVAAIVAIMVFCSAHIRNTSDTTHNRRHVIKKPACEISNIRILRNWCARVAWMCRNGKACWLTCILLWCSHRMLCVCGALVQLMLCNYLECTLRRVLTNNFCFKKKACWSTYVFLSFFESTRWVALTRGQLVSCVNFGPGRRAEARIKDSV